MSKLPQNWPRRGARLMIGITTLLLLYLLVGPFVTSTPGGGFYSVHEVHLGILSYFRWIREYGVYGYFVENETFDFRPGRALATAALVSIILLVSAISRRRLK